MSTTGEEIEIISCCDDFIEDGHADNKMVEDQNDLKQPTVSSSSYNGPIEPCLSFVYAIQVDENGCMGNCFWADARSRATYQYFGDVVTFDATYLTNCCKMPFVPFTGVNHHHQSVMFECALLINETAESYTWLLKTWLEAMLGRAPSTIITDDDKAMGKAIADVLPNTTHRLCLWHILQKVPEHLAHIYNKYPSFQRDFQHCIHNTITIEEFEME
ncbi:hypothetical protein SLA2020_415140 [Shorea laevis]